MIIDFLKRGKGPGRRKQRPLTRHKTKRTTGLDRRLFMKSAGIMLIGALLLAVGSSFWYGLRVKLVLEEIGSQQALRQELTLRNRALADQRKRLLSREQLEKAAARLGLFPPEPDQLR